MDFLPELTRCAPSIHADTMRRIVQVESAFNPYAVGVVGARLDHQPRTYGEAIATIGWLDANGYNYSVGLAQVNKHNFRAHGLTAETALDACANLRAAATILTECFARASVNYETQTALRAAFSCYESGNFRTGFRDGYVWKILASTSPTVLPAPAPALSTNACRGRKKHQQPVVKMSSQNPACSATSSAQVR